MDYKRSVCMNPNGKKIWLQQQYIPCARGNIQKKKELKRTLVNVCTQKWENKQRTENTFNFFSYD